MKLRIRGNSIRLRLLQTEVTALGETKRVDESICFGPENNQSMIYAVEVAKNAAAVSAVLDKNEIRVELPAEIASKWINSDEVGISAEISNGEGTLQILVEKDFVCLTRTDDPDNLDAFPNPDSEC